MVALCKELFAGEHERQRLREEQGEMDTPNPFLVHTRTMKGKCKLGPCWIYMMRFGWR